MGNSPKVQKKRWINAGFVILAVVSIIGFALWNIYLQDQKKRDNLVNQAKYIAQAIDSEILLHLSGTPADQSSPHYQHLKQQLMTIRHIYPDVRFMYVMGRKENGSIFFYVDSEPPGSETETLPGDIYREAPEEEIESIQEGAPTTVNLETDERGIWITALYPIRDHNSGETIAAFRMEIHAQDWLKDSIQFAGLPILVFVIFVILIIGTVGVFRYRKNKPETYRKHFVTRYALVFCTGLLGACLTILSSWYAVFADDNARWDSFDRLAGFHAESVTTSITNIDKTSLESIKQFFQGSDFVTREEFSKFTEHLLDDPFISAWSWIPEVPRDQFLEVTTTAQKEGLSQFRIWQWSESGEQIFSVSQDVAFPILYISPFDLEDSALGFDLASTEDKLDLLLFTMETGITTATDTCSITQGDNESGVIFVFKPITLEDNPSGQVGVTAAIVRSERILESVHLESIRQDEDPEDISLYTDIFQIDQNGNIQLLSSTSPESYQELHLSGNLQEHVDAEFTFIKPLFLFGNTYVIVSHPSPGFYQSHPANGGTIVAVSGTFITLVVMLLVGNYADRNYILTDMVKQRTAELEESERRFQVALKNSPVVVYQQDKNLRYTWIHNLTPESESFNVIGKTDEELLQPDEANLLTQIKRQVMETGEGVRQIVQVTIEGKTHHYDMTAEPIKSETGESIGITCSSVDITDLVEAYEATIEGWSVALELRDQETKGHTLRVTEMTLQLAAAMGMSKEELVHVRRGALLHDIGKIGIPDEILLKPGKLTAKEWKVMKQHPIFAYDMLSPIAYLGPALDIPYCHHEKWDGSGYPRGLKGEEIPLAARIFAIIDVWDALLSDRPYRGPWSEEKVRDYIHSLSGSHFDPAVVKAFFEIVDSLSEYHPA